MRARPPKAIPKSARDDRYVCCCARVRIALTLVSVALAVACVGAPPVRTFTDPSTPKPTEIAASSPTATEPRPSPTIDPAAIVTASPLGALRGNWIFAGKYVRHPELPQARVEVWAIPVADGAPRLAFAYTVATVGLGPMDTTPYLRRLFSPDGRRMVVSVNGALVLVDLEAGRAQSLGVGGQFPSWSKDGSHIALTYHKPVEQVVPPGTAVGVVPITGGSVREMGVTDSPHLSVEWSADGSMLLLPQSEGVAVVDVATARVVRRLARTTPAASSFAHWRAQRPAIAIGGYACELGSASIAVLDDLQQEPRFVNTGRRCPEMNLSDPRWNPANANELLYVQTRHAPGAEASGHAAYIVDLATGRDVALGLSAYEATWTSDGRQVVYIRAAPRPLFAGQTVRIWSRADGRERALLTATGTDVFFSVASVSY